MKAESWWNQRNKANSWQACYGFWWNGAFMYHQEIYESAMNGMLLPSILSGLYLVHHPRIRAICWLQKGLAVFPIACHTFPMKALSKKYFKKCVSELRKKILSNAYVLLCYNCVYTVFCIPLPFVCIVSYKHRAYFSLALTNLFLMTCFNMYCWITITTLTGLVFIEHNSPAMCVLCFWIECSLVKSSNEKHPQPHPDWLSPLFIWGTSAGWTEAFWIKTLQAGLTGRISAICLWMAANQSPISHVFPRVWVWQSVKKEKYLCKHFDYLSSSYLTYIKIWLTVIYEMCNIVNI